MSVSNIKHLKVATANKTPAKLLFTSVQNNKSTPKDSVNKQNKISTSSTKGIANKVPKDSGSNYYFKKCKDCSEKNKEIKELTEKVEKLKFENVKLNKTIQNGSYIDHQERKAGLLPENIAKKHKMEEIMPGVYITQEQLIALENKTSTSKAAFLLDCFYSKEEQLNMSVKGTYGKQAIDPRLLDAIIVTQQKNRSSR